MPKVSPLGFFPLPHIVGIFTLVAISAAIGLWPSADNVGISLQRYTLELPSATSSNLDSMLSSTEQTDTPNFEQDNVVAGDSLSVIFSRNDLSMLELTKVVSALPSSAITLNVGQTIRWQRTINNQLSSFEIVISPLVYHRAERQPDGDFSYELVQRNADFVPRYVTTEISGSLFLDGNRAGIPSAVLYQLVDIFGWDIDFAMDIRKGDRISLIYEELFLDGEKIKTGDILIAKFINRNRTLTAVRYEDDQGKTDYYSPEGLNLRKEFLRNPIDFARVSSRFNLRRKHPVLNRIRAHKGTDYAAPTGTPIKATGEGKVIHAGRKGGYGNVVIIQHGQRYQTLYAHLSKFGRSVRVGRRVRQGQIIGYVGSTGLATGPHLHYEFLVDGVHRDSLRVKLPKAKSVASSQRIAFEEQTDRLVSWLNSYQPLAQDTEIESNSKPNVSRLTGSSNG